MAKLKNHCLNMPPHFSMDEYMDAVEFLLDFKTPSHVQKQKAMEEFIQTPFSFDYASATQTQSVKDKVNDIIPELTAKFPKFCSIKCWLAAFAFLNVIHGVEPYRSCIHSSVILMPGTIKRNATRKKKLVRMGYCSLSVKRQRQRERRKQIPACFIRYRDRVTLSLCHSERSRGISSGITR